MPLPDIGFLGGFLSPTSMSTRTGFANPEDPSSLVKVPWRTNFAELAVLAVLEAVLLIEGAGDARGALPLGMALFLAVILGDGGEFNLSLVACLSWVDLVPLGDPGILLATAGALTIFLGLGAIAGLGGT